MSKLKSIQASTMQNSAIIFLSMHHR